MQWKLICFYNNSRKQHQSTDHCLIYVYSIIQKFTTVSYTSNLQALTTVLHINNITAMTTVLYVSNIKALNTAIFTSNTQVDYYYVWKQHQSTAHDPLFKQHEDSDKYDIQRVLVWIKEEVYSRHGAEIVLQQLQARSNCRAEAYKKLWFSTPGSRHTSGT